MKNLKDKVLYVEHGKYKITPFGIRFLSLALKKKFSYRKIAEKLGISAETLSYRCREYNISSRKDIPGRKKKYPFLENYFENIDCPEKAYWLGFYRQMDILMKVEILFKYRYKKEIKDI